MSDVDRDEDARDADRPADWDAVRSLLDVERGAERAPLDAERDRTRGAIGRARRGEPASRGPRFKAGPRTVGIVAAAFVAGACAGVWIGPRLTARAPLPQLSVPASSPSGPSSLGTAGPSSLGTADAPTPSPAPPPLTSPSAAPLAAASSTRPSNDTRDRATRERTLLDRARATLARGDTDGGLDAIAEHQRDYPNGTLVEEREYLAIRALARAGRAEDARARATRFARRFPNSVFLPAIEALAP